MWPGPRYSLIILRLYNNAVDDLVINTISQRCVVLEELYLQDSPAAPKARETEKLVWEVTKHALVLSTAVSTGPLRATACTQPHPCPPLPTSPAPGYCLLSPNSMSSCCGRCLTSGARAHCVQGGEDGKRLGVSTRGIYLLMNGRCQRLRRLQLASCELLGYDAVQHIVNAPPNVLRDLQLRACRICEVEPGMGGGGGWGGVFVRSRGAKGGGRGGWVRIVWAA
jgi:hypothetical protein